MKKCILGLVAEKPFNVGLTGRELLTPVAGFRITSAGSYLVTIEIISVASAASTEYCCSKGSFVFLLMGEELVTGVIYCVTNGWVTGIRFVTTMRTSQWFGTRSGDVKTYSTDSLSFLHSICYRSENEGISSLGVVVWKRSAESKSVEQRDQQVIKAEKPFFSLAFRSVASEVRGVLVTLGTGNHVASIDVLPPSEFEHFVALLSYVSLPVNEFMVEISRGEQIVGVELWYTQNTVAGIRFETTRRTTPWIGRVKATSSSSTLFLCEPDNAICGFFASALDSIGFGVVTRDRVTG